MKLLALTIGGNGGPTTYPVNLPSQIANLTKLNLQGIVRFGITFVLTIAILLAFFFVVFGGLKWILSQGDKKQLEEAQKTLQFAIIGLIVVLLSFFIVNLIGYAFNVSLLGR